MVVKMALAALLSASVVCLAGAAEVTIANVSGITGPNAATGAETMKETIGYIDYVNAKGGVNGNKLKLVYRDDQYDPKKTAALVGEVIANDNPAGFLNLTGTANAYAVIKSGVLAQNKMPVVGVFSGSELIRGPGSEQLFHTRVGYNEEIQKISRLASTIGIKRIAVLYQDDSFGASINQSIAKAVDEFKFEVVDKAAYKSGDKNFSKQVKEIVDSKPQAIFLMGVPEAVALFMKAYEAPAERPQIYTLSFVPAKYLMEVAGDKHARGVGISQVVPNPNVASLPLATEFQNFLKTPYGKGVSSNPLNFEVFLNVRLMIEAIRMAGPKPTPEKVTQALISMKGYMLSGYPISFGETNRVGAHYQDIGVVGSNGRLAY
jgi:ABC-type branched-subunit amino acid transport system substrate-binding protein